MSNILPITYLEDNSCQLDVNNRHFYCIREHFSYDNPQARFGNNPYAPKRLYNISSRGICDIGLIFKIKEFCESEGFDIKIKIDDKVKSRIFNPIEYDIEEVPSEKFTLRDYQFDCISNAFKIGNGVILVGTGGGKSLIIASMLESIWVNNPDFKAILVVPNISLIEQMYKDFDDYDCSFSKSKWSGKNKLNPDTNVIIVNTGLIQRFTKEKKEEFAFVFENAEYLFYDEVHLFGNDPEPKASIYIKNFEYKHKFGFTGSLEEHNFGANQVYGFFGKVIYEKTSKELRDENYLTNVEVKMIKFYHQYDSKDIYDFNYSNKIEKREKNIKNYNNEIDYITFSQFRINKLKQIIKNLDGNMLLLVDRINQGETLFKELSELENKQVCFIHGGVDVKDRAEIISQMEINNNIICIAMTKIFSTGISINNLPYLSFYYIGKAWYKIIQSVGRGLRLHERKNKLYIFDMYDNMVFSEKHAAQRKNIYDKQKIDYKEIEIEE